MTHEILLTNDDGIDAVGLRALSDALSREHEVSVSPLSSSLSLAGDRAGEVVTVGVEAPPRSDGD